MKLFRSLSSVSYTGRISRLGFLLIAIAFFLTIISFVKGIQILIFIPAFVLAVFVYSLYELIRIRRNMNIELRSDAQWNYLRVFIKKWYKYNFILANKNESWKLVFLEPDLHGKYYFTKETPYNLFLYIFWSFDIFRLTKSVGNIFFSDQRDENDDFLQSEKYESGKQIIKIDTLRSSLSDVPYIKQSYSVSGKQYEQSDFFLQSNDPLSIVSGEKLGKFHIFMILIGMCAVAIEWLSPMLDSVMVITALIIFLLRNKRGKLPEKLKNMLLLSSFFLMLILTRVLWDMSWAGSVFLLQILMIIYLFPRDFKNSFLYIFLLLFVFVAVSLFSNQIWFIVLFILYLCISIYLLFYISGTESFESAQYKLGNKISKKNFFSAYISVVSLMIVFFILLPHGTASESRTNIGNRDNEWNISWFNEEISLENIQNIKEDRRKVIVVEDLQLDDVERLWLDYFRGRRYHYFDGKRWWGAFSWENYVLENDLKNTDITLSMKYYLNGSRYIYMPASPSFITWTNIRFWNTSSDATILRSYLWINEPLSLQVWFKTTQEGRIRDAQNAEITVPSYIENNVADIFAQYISQIPEEITDSPAALSEYVQNESGFEYDTFDVAENISDFLYGKKVWHCEYYATVLTIVLQHFWFKPTFVSGFWYGEYNSLADSYIVRASSAHTWVELYDEETKSWTIYDPTPWASLSARQLIDSSLEQLIEIYDFIDIKWYTYIVNYTREEQQKVYVYLLGKIWYIAILIFMLFCIAFFYRKLVLMVSFVLLSKQEKILFLLMQKYDSPEIAFIQMAKHDVLLAKKIEKYIYADSGEVSYSEIFKIVLK